MEAKILRKLLAQRIPPEQFQLHGSKIVYVDPEQNNKPVGENNESPYDTPENRAIVEDVIAHYDALSADFIREQSLTIIRAERDRRLDDTDLKHCNAEKWSKMSESERSKWSAYKQALRDLPAYIVDLDNPAWPERPQI